MILDHTVTTAAFLTLLQEWPWAGHTVAMMTLDPTAPFIPLLDFLFSLLPH